jgi:hypothetical protein
MERIYINVNYNTYAKSLCKKVEKVVIDRLVNNDSRYYLIRNLWNCYYFYSSNESRLNAIESFLRQHKIILIIKN